MAALRKDWNRSAIRRARVMGGMFILGGILGLGRLLMGGFPWRVFKYS
jgi:hypothetical protein